jgi:hypothetical protein
MVVATKPMMCVRQESRPAKGVDAPNAVGVYFSN